MFARSLYVIKVPKTTQVHYQSTDFAKSSEPQPVDFDNLLSMASASDEEDPVVPSSTTEFVLQ